jgi:hypothetical protein
MATNLLAQRIEDVLTPVVGTVLAAVSVEVEAKRLGKLPDAITRDDLVPLADNLATALILVVGKDLADAAAGQVRMLA